jgi:hypothetical protein
MNWLNGARLRRASDVGVSQTATDASCGIMSRTASSSNMIARLSRLASTPRSFEPIYWYRDSGQAARDYEGFPTLLFVATDPNAEQRIADAAYRAWFIRRSEPLPVLITTTDRITGDREGILGRVWRTSAPARVPTGVDREYWLPGGPPRSRLVCSTAPRVTEVHGSVTARPAVFSCPVQVVLDQGL